MSGGDSRPLKVLVADDAKLVRLLIIDLLKDSPFQVSITESSDGTDACRQLLSGDFDIAFLDVIMPGIDGLSALELSHRQNSQTFIVIISSESDEQKLQRARRFRAYEYLKKPFTTKQIIQILNNYQRIRNPYRVLVVDDSGAVRKIVGRMLQKSFFNFYIEEASDGQATLDVCNDRVFDIIFLDIVMPGLSGVDVLRNIREYNSETKIILMTADENFKLTDDIKGLNAVTVLHKPFSQFDVDKNLHDIFGIENPRLNN
jgi:CheY-like chemotaxis protein